ncbi:MAG: hypothetical protein WBO34_12935, partial [Gammaproteobacteria bacterium]
GHGTAAPHAGSAINFVTGLDGMKYSFLMVWKPLIDSLTDLRAPLVVTLSANIPNCTPNFKHRLTKACPNNICTNIPLLRSVFISY